MKLIETTACTRFVQLTKGYIHYDVVAEQPTKIAMQQLAITRWSFPMYAYFQSIDEVATTTWLQRQRASQTYTTISLSGVHKKPIPTYMAQLNDAEALQQLCDDFFYVAEQNFLFVLANEPCLQLEAEPMHMISKSAELLIAYYDGQGATFYTTKEENR